jgi:hypothetical protein
MAFNIPLSDKSKLSWLLGILIPIFITLLLGYERISLLLAPYYLTVIEGLIIIIAIVIIYLIFYKSINDITWLIKRKWKFCNPIIAIIKEEGCMLKATRYTPSDWRDYFDKRYKTKIISCKDISNRYAVLINPYGEVYPEEDLFVFKTFSRIMEFIKRGGIFVNVGGFAFYYGWDITSKKEPTPIADVYRFYKGEIKDKEIELHPRQSIKGSLLTTGTLLFERLKITTTFDFGPKEYKIYQTESDKEFIGNIEDIGKTKTIEEYRSVREPVFRCQPLLRANTQTYGEIYPLAAIPLGRGYFIIGGMNLEHENDISNSSFLKSCKAIENIIEKIQKGYIKPSPDIE